MFRESEQGVLRVAAWDRHRWLVHGFSTRATGDFFDWPGDAEIAAAFGTQGCGTATLRQVHSGRWVRADAPWGGKRPEADAVLTDRPGVLVGVRTADCLPVLLVDPATRSVAAVHAGWRGVVAGIVPNAVRALQAEGIAARLVSMPSVDVFEQQQESWREAVLPGNVRKRVAVEAGAADYWRKFVGLEGEVIGMTGFGESAPGGVLMEHFGFTAERVASVARSLLE